MTNCAAPPAHPATKVFVYCPEPLKRSDFSIIFRVVPYTPKNIEFIAPADKMGYHMPLKNPRGYDKK